MWAQSRPFPSARPLLSWPLVIYCWINAVSSSISLPCLSRSGAVCGGVGGAGLSVAELTKQRGLQIDRFLFFRSDIHLIERMLCLTRLSWWHDWKCPLEESWAVCVCVCVCVCVRTYFGGGGRYELQAKHTILDSWERAGRPRKPLCS